jgi:hypothetical protein
MRPQDMRDARGQLGKLWGLGRPLRMAELGRLLRLQGRDVGATIRDWERGKSPISGPASVAVRALLEGWKPGEWRDYLTPAGGRED